MAEPAIFEGYHRPGIGAERHGGGAKNPARAIGADPYAELAMDLPVGSSAGQTARRGGGGRLCPGFPQSGNLFWRQADDLSLAIAHRLGVGGRDGHKARSHHHYREAVLDHMRI